MGPGDEGHGKPFLLKGSTITLPSFTLEIADDGQVKCEPIQIHIAINVVGPWLEIMLDRMSDSLEARASLVQAMADDDVAAVAAALVAETTAGMQVAVSGGIVLDAVYAGLRDRLDLPSETLAAWRDGRTARKKQMLEVFRRAVRLKPGETDRARPLVFEVVRLRDAAVHPHAEARPPVFHDVLGRGVEERIVLFRSENARLLARAVLALLYQAVGRPDPANEAIAKYLGHVGDSIRDSVARWRDTYGPLLDHE